MSQIEHIKKLLSIRECNLQILKEREAAYGLDVPVSVLNQIASEEAEIENLQAELKSLGGAAEGGTSPAGAGSDQTSASTSQAGQSGGGVTTFNFHGDVNFGDGSIFAGRDASNIQTAVTKNPDPAQIAELFKTLYRDIDNSTAPLKEQAKDLTQQLEKEVTGPDSEPDENKIEGLLKGIRAMAPDIFEVAIATFANPLAGAAMVINKIGEKIKADAEQG